MRNFTFTLDRVLRLREEQLQLSEAVFKRLLAERGEIEAEIVKLDTSAQQAQWAVRSVESIHGADLASLEYFVDRIHRERIAALGRLNANAHQLETQRKAITEARSRVRLLERLRDKQKLEWKMERDREEQTQAEDFSAAKWLRLRRSANE
jgi:flagellar export protein FliJ